MSVFICWSGTRSSTIAKAVKVLLNSEKKLDLEGNAVFISGGIEKGATWFQSIVDQLKKSTVGIVCLTPENLNNPWLHFEAGALSRALEDDAPQVSDREAPPAPVDNAATAPVGNSSPTASNISPKSGNHRLLIPLLHGVSAAEMKGPLSAYQATCTSREDLAAMMSRVGDLLNKPGKYALSDDQWTQFQSDLGVLAVPARDLIPDFECYFRNASFNQPCQDQDWMRCYDGVLLSRERLRSHHSRVRAACLTHELELFEMLLSELESYAGAVEALLRSANSGPGEPERLAKLQDCERRRLAVKSMSCILLDPPDAPLRNHAVQFLAAETYAERNMLVLAMEGEIRRERDAVFEAEEPPGPAAEPAGNSGMRSRFDQAMNTLVGAREPTKFRESSWDLDRIFYYLLIRYFASAPIRWKPGHPTNMVESEKPATHHWRCAGRDVTLELERYKLGSKGASLLPLKYSLDALATIEKANGLQSPDPVVTRAAILSAVSVVRTDLAQELTQPGIEVGAQIERVLNRLATLLERGTGPRTGSAGAIGDAK